MKALSFNLTLSQSCALLASIFLVIIPIATIGRYFNNAEISKILIHLLVNLFALVLFLKSPKIKMHNEIKQLKFSVFRLTILSVLCLMPLLAFVSGSIQGSNLVDIAIFSEQYRQGAYSGSGIYTAWATQVLPLIVFVILITNGFNKSLLIPIFVILFASAILGLRVYLWRLFIGLLLISVGNLNVKRIFYGIIFILLFFSYKLLLNPQSELAFHDLFIEQLTRPDLHAIVKYEPFSDNLIGVLEYFPFLRKLYGHEISAFKNFYIPSIPNLSVLMPFVSLYSGVALPGHVLIYNSLFVLAIIPNFFILLLIYNLIVFIRNSRNIFLKFFCAYLFIVISLAFLEDVNALYKLEEEIIFIFASYIAFVLISRRTSYNSKDVADGGVKFF